MDNNTAVNVAAIIMILSTIMSIIALLRFRAYRFAKEKLEKEKPKVKVFPDGTTVTEVPSYELLDQWEDLKDQEDLLSFGQPTREIIKSLKAGKIYPVKMAYDNIYSLSKGVIFKSPVLRDNYSLYAQQYPSFFEKGIIGKGWANGSLCWMSKEEAAAVFVVAEKVWEDMGKKEIENMRQKSIQKYCVNKEG